MSEIIRPDAELSAAAVRLGVNLANVTPAELKARGRQLAKVHHPDRFAGQGEETIKTQTARFQMLQTDLRSVEAHVRARPWQTWVPQDLGQHVDVRM